MYNEVEAAQTIWGTGEGSLKADGRYSEVLIDASTVAQYETELANAQAAPLPDEDEDL